MNYKVTQVFVPTSVDASSAHSALATQALGFYNSALTTNLGASPSATEGMIVLQSGQSKFGTFKSGVIKKSNITALRKTTADSTVKQQITYLGFDEVTDTKVPSFSCDEEYVVTLKIQEYWIKGIFQPMLQESVRVKTTLCTECGGGCDSLNCYPFMQEIVDKINANPLLSKYVTASHVYKGSAPTYKYTLTLQDPGTSVGGVATVQLDTTSATGFTNNSYTAITQTSTSGSGTGASFNFTVAGNVITAVSVNAAGSGYVNGEVITFAGTKITGGTTPADDFTITVVSTTGPEGVLLDALKTYYPAATYGAITYTADTDGDPDAGATGNIMFEIASPLVDIKKMPVYKGIAWQKVQTSAGSVTTCGVKLVGNTLDEFGNACVPDAVPYVFNAVRFKVSVHKAPFTSQDFDLEDAASPWSIANTQDVQFAIGDGKALAEMERNHFTYNLPNVMEARYYWNPIYNEDVKFYVDKTKTYNMYELNYIEASNVGYEKKTENEHSLVVLIDSTNSAAISAFETAIQAFTGLTL